MECPECGKKETELTRSHNLLNEEIMVLSCMGCGFVFVSCDEGLHWMPVFAGIKAKEKPEYDPDM